MTGRWLRNRWLVVGALLFITTTAAEASLLRQTVGSGVNQAHVVVAFGDLFNAYLPKESLRLKGKNFVLDGKVEGGIAAVSLSYAKERISVRGGDLDLGNVPEGPVSLLLIVRQDGTRDVRAVLVRANRSKKILKY